MVSRLWHGKVLAGALLCLMAAGCAPSPDRQQQTSEFRNGADDVSAARLVPGKTTRDEVVEMFGDPDGAAIDDRWMVWTTGYSDSGLRLGRLSTAVSAQKQHYKRLTVVFNERGIVTSSHEDEKSCVGPGAAADPQPIWQPCTGWKWFSGEQP